MRTVEKSIQVIDLPVDGLKPNEDWEVGGGGGVVVAVWWIWGWVWMRAVETSK